MNYFTWLFTLLVPILAFSKATIYDDLSQNNWHRWGSAKSTYTTKIGNKSTGALSISAMLGQEGTYYRKFTGLRPGFYKVSAWIKGDRIQEGEWETSFWHFYASAGPEKSPFRNIHGSFSWSKLSYTAKVVDGSLELWFRLKSPGKVWIDDIKIEAVSKDSKKLEFTPNKIKKQSKNLITTNKACFGDRLKKVLTLYNFDNKDPGPFDRIKNKKAVFSSHKYYHFDSSIFEKINSKKYDYLEIDVYYPRKKSNSPMPIYIVFADDLTNGYWSQLNFTSTLAPGKNHLSLPLNRNVGERGSFKVKRKINYKNLEKFWLIVDPDRLVKATVKLQIDNIKLTTKSHVKFFKGLKAFDFATDQDSAFSCFTPVTSQNTYIRGDEYGFMGAKFWRSHNSKYADGLNKDTIIVTEGVFRVHLPNGDYKMLLNWNMLGYWDVPFWKKRILYIQGKPAVGELRSSASDYLMDFLRFENIEPTPDDHPWQLYLKQLFTPIEKDFTVTKGYLDLGFEGDPTGIALNWLLIWPKDKDKNIAKFTRQLEHSTSEDFDRHIRFVKLDDSKQNIKSDIVKLSDTLTRVSPSQNNLKSIKKLKLRGLKEMTLNAQLIIRTKEESSANIKIAPFKSKKGTTLKIVPKLFKGQYQYMSYDRNHETYTLATRQLRPIGLSGINTRKNINEQILLQFKLPANAKPGLYHSKLQVSLKSKSWSFPISVQLFKGTLPKVDLSVGFLGLNPVQFSYYEGPEIDREKRLWRTKALKELTTRGFNTWSGIPKLKVKSEQNSWSFTSEDIDDLFGVAKNQGIKGPIFSYGGDFLQETISDLDSKQLQNFSDMLKTFIAKKNWPPIVLDFSDEALGYSDTLERDIKKGKTLKKYFPFFKRGGFSHMSSNMGSGKKLHDLFTNGSYSNYHSKEARRIQKRGNSWGLYNQASAPFDNPTHAFGAALFKASQFGASHLLGWHFSGIHNYPYYDLDGRENDASMIYPNSSGEFYSTIKFEQAHLGLQTYRLLLLLNKRIKKSKNNKKREIAMRWLKGRYLKEQNIQFKIFELLKNL